MSPQQQGTPQDEQGIKRTATEFITGWNRHDAKAMAACFAPDGDLINPEGQTCRGKSAVEKLLTEEQTGEFKGSRANMPQTHLRFLKPDFAIADYDLEISNVRGNDGKELSVKAEVTNVYRKQNDQWLIVAARAMVPVPALVAQHR